MKILLAEDDPLTWVKLKHFLEDQGYEVVAATGGVQALEELMRDDGPNLAVLDWMMPGLDGIEVCRRLRTQLRSRYVYVMLLSAKSEHLDLMVAMGAGADDYMTKPAHPAEFLARLRAGERVLQVHAELVRLREELAGRDLHDGLTETLNRRGAGRVLRRELARSARTGEPLAVLRCDLDEFKRVNAAHGYPAGNEVLSSVAERMAGAIRPFDWLCRVDGEEFLLVLPSVDLEEAVKIAERLRTVIAERPFLAGGAPVRLTASIGLCALGDGAGLHPDDVLTSAAEALELAMRSGRDRVEIAPPPAPRDEDDVDEDPDDGDSEPTAPQESGA